MSESVLRIDAENHPTKFCAYCIAQNGKIVEAAPILKWSRGKTVLEFTKYCQKKKWRFQFIHKQN